MSFPLILQVRNDSLWTSNKCALGIEDIRLLLVLSGKSVVPLASSRVVEVSALRETGHVSSIPHVRADSANTGAACAGTAP